MEISNIDQFCSGPAGQTPASSRIPSLEVLTQADRVLARDLWNKFLAHDNMLAHLFFERLQTIAPDEAECFAQAAWRAPYVYLKLLDLTARTLVPETEKPRREGHTTAPAAERSQCETIDDCIAFFCALDLPTNLHEKSIEAFVWTCTKVPVLEDFDRANLRSGLESAAGRFFCASVVDPLIAAKRAKEAALSAPVLESMQRGTEAMIGRQHEAGSFFYGTLFKTYPETMRHFRTSDMDQMSRHLIDTIVLLGKLAADPDRMRSELMSLASVHLNYRIPVGDYPRLAQPLLETLETFGTPMTDGVRAGWQILFDQAIRIIAEPMVLHEWLVGEARKFVVQVAEELCWSPERLSARISEVTREIEVTGSYTHSFQELEYGAKLAWRNAAKCIGRISWKNLIVRDCRHVSDADSIHRECVEHLRAATNSGNIEIVLSAFRPQGPKEPWGPRIWNSQLIRYAGYEREDGTTLGDGANVELTRAIMKLGWQPPEPSGPYDILPLVIDVPGDAPRICTIDQSEVAEIEISHPTEPGIAALGMKWCAVPAITNFNLELGGLRYSCVPFNGWFMGTEIARNLWEEKRYDRANDIAEALGLDTSSEMTLWRDRAFLELNVAILHSFQEAKVTLVDHHTASRQFLYHDTREKKAGRECPAQWSWIAPPAGGSTTPTWHHEMRDFQLAPSFEYEADRWMAFEEQTSGVCPMKAGGVTRSRNRRPLILFASETGTAEAYARKIGRRLANFGAEVRAMDEISLKELRGEARVLFVVATCRDGDIPENGRALVQSLLEDPSALEGVVYAVLGLGNRIYSKFCAAAFQVDDAARQAGGSKLAAVECADEIAGQGDTVRSWIDVFEKTWRIDSLSTERKRMLVEMVPSRRVEPESGSAMGVVRSNDELLTYPADANDRILRSTRRICIELPSSGDNYEESRYAPGDHLAVHPVNPDDLVERVARHLDLPVDAWFKLHGSFDPSHDLYRAGYSLKRLLGETLDLGIPEAPEELVSAMLETCDTAEEKKSLADLLANLNGDTARQAALRGIRRNYLDVADLFDAFPHSVPGLQILIELLPKLKPRYYSVASSPLVAPDTVTLVPGVFSRETSDGRRVKGICSHYLARLENGSRVRIALKPAPRRLPENPNAPLVLIAAGTGIAPIIGILEDRIARGAASEPSGPISFYFGCRCESEFLFRDKILTWLKQGKLSRLVTAFSREATPRAYVQDAIDTDGEQLWLHLQRRDAQVMIAGDAKMAQDVVERFIIIARREGGMGNSQAQQLIDDMRNEGRLIEDIWGIQLNHDHARSEMLKAKYDSGARWFSRLQKAFGRTPVTSSAIRFY